MARQKPTPLGRDMDDNMQEPGTRGMVMWEDYALTKECELVIEDEKLQHTRKLRREQTRRYRARRRQ